MAGSSGNDELTYLTYLYQGKEITDWNDLTQKMHSEEIKSFHISIKAPQHRTVENLTISHNGPKDSMKITHENKIPAGKSITVSFEIHASKLWQANKPKLDLEFNYDLVLESMEAS
ncbi:MAG: hypothetical protein OXC46_03125 [Thaumarchaeota archaeon]|nr:hypothetical protein [Nitrososphaerota archaeon]